MTRSTLDFGPIDIRNDDIDDTSLSWFFDEDKGGFPLSSVHRLRKTFGKSNKTISQGNFTYLYNFRYNSQSSRDTPFTRAFDAFAKGLLSVVNERYDDFCVPRGRYKGKTIRQVRNKKYLEQVSFDKGYWTKFSPVFYLAVEAKLEHPRHYLALRDIGKNLRAPALTFRDNVNLRWRENEGEDTALEDFLDDDADENSDEVWRILESLKNNDFSRSEAGNEEGSTSSDNDGEGPERRPNTLKQGMSPSRIGRTGERFISAAFRKANISDEEGDSDLSFVVADDSDEEIEERRGEPSDSDRREENDGQANASESSSEGSSDFEPFGHGKRNMHFRLKRRRRVASNSASEASAKDSDKESEIAAPSGDEESSAKFTSSSNSDSEGDRFVVSDNESIEEDTSSSSSRDESDSEASAGLGEVETIACRTRSKTTTRRASDGEEPSSDASDSGYGDIDREKQKRPTRRKKRSNEDRGLLRRRVFIGKVQESWGLGPNPKIRDLSPQPPDARCHYVGRKELAGWVRRRHEERARQATGSTTSRIRKLLTASLSASSILSQRQASSSPMPSTSQRVRQTEKPANFNSGPGKENAGRKQLWATTTPTKSSRLGVSFESKGKQLRESSDEEPPMMSHRRLPRNSSTNVGPSTSKFSAFTGPMNTLGNAVKPLKRKRVFVSPSSSDAGASSSDERLAGASKGNWRGSRKARKALRIGSDSDVANEEEVESLLKSPTSSPLFTPIISPVDISL